MIINMEVLFDLSVLDFVDYVLGKFGSNQCVICFFGFPDANLHTVHISLLIL